MQGDYGKLYTRSNKSKHMKTNHHKEFVRTREKRSKALPDRVKARIPLRVPAPIYTSVTYGLNLPWQQKDVPEGFRNRASIRCDYS
jgi:hypothetical protein